MKYDDLVIEFINKVKALVKKYYIIKDGRLITQSVTFGGELSQLDKLVKDLDTNLTEKNLKTLIDYIQKIVPQQTTSKNKAEFLKELSNMLNIEELRHAAGDKIEKIEVLGKQIDETNRQLQELNNTLSLKNAKLEGELKGLETFKAQQENSEMLNKQKDKESQELREQYNKLHLENTKLEKELETLTMFKKQLEEKENELQRLRNENETLKVAKAKLEGELTVTKAHQQSVVSNRESNIGFFNEKNSSDKNSKRDSSTIMSSSRYSIPTPKTQSPAERLSDLIGQIRGKDAESKLRSEVIQIFVDFCKTGSESDKVLCGYMTLELITGEIAISNIIAAVFQFASDSLKMKLGAIDEKSKQYKDPITLDFSKDKRALTALASLYQDYYAKEPKYFPKEFIAGKFGQQSENFRQQIANIYSNALDAYKDNKKHMSIA